MIFDHSFVLLGLTILWCIILCISEYNKKRKITKNNVIRCLGVSFESVIGMYAIVYAITIITLNSVGFAKPFPQDNAALTVALLYGGVHMVYRKN